jgi:hypothetical protein
MAKTELKQHSGVAWDGSIVEHDQWYVTIDGVNLGLLCKTPGSRVMPLMEGNKLSDEQWLQIIAECSTITGHPVLPPIHFYVPPDEPTEVYDEADDDEPDEDEVDGDS